MGLNVTSPENDTPAPPKPTGNLATDVSTAVGNIGSYPCARNSLLTGIGGGIAFGFIRGMTTKNPIVAGNWAMGTFCLLSLGSWHLCKWQYKVEKEKVKAFMAKNNEAQKRRVLKNPEQLGDS